MKVLIFGSTGFVGRYIVRYLYDYCNVILPVRNIEKAKKVFNDLPKLEFLHLEKENFNKSIQQTKPDIVINLIGILREKGDDTFEKVHYLTTKAILESALSNSVKKFIQMSALGADINSKSRYLKTKAMAENEIIKSGIDFIIFRPSIILGKEQKLFEDFKNYSKIAPVFLAPEDAKVQPVNIYDVAESFKKATLEDLKNNVYQLCGPKVINYVELFKFALGYLNIKRLVIPVPKKTFFFLIPFFSVMPEPIMTLDQYYMLEKDNVCDRSFKTAIDLLGSVRNPFVF